MQQKAPKAFADAFIKLGTSTITDLPKNVVGLAAVIYLVAFGPGQTLELTIAWILYQLLKRKK